MLLCVAIYRSLASSLPTLHCTLPYSSPDPVYQLYQPNSHSIVYSAQLTLLLPRLPDPIPILL